MNEDNLQCPVTAKEGADDDIIGKWKLVKAETIKLAYGISIEDYSCNNIIYHFQEDDSLVISGISEGMPGHENGEYSFEFNDAKLYEGIEEEYTVKIEDMSIACSIQDNHMVLNNSFLDGDILYFVRIE